MMRFTTHDGKYSIASHGNGWAYAVTCQQTGDSFWVQDDEASRLQAETHDFAYTDTLEEYFAY